MYIPGSTDDYALEDMAVYGPREHQRVIAKLTTGLGILYFKDGKIRLEPLPETMLDEGQASPTPDLILADNENELTPIIIEVCHTKGLKHDLNKVIRLIDEAEYGIQEGFIYNYKTNEWLRYRKGDGGVLESTSFSALLQLNLSSFL